jgi:transcriptional regulator with GAF, ATPase, and Fis domain
MDTLKDKIKGMERGAIIEALRESNWVMAQAARKLGITERMIGYKIKKYGLRIKEVRWIEDTQQIDSDQDRNRHI